jgi:pyruvate formate lyase activating enzyme
MKLDSVTRRDFLRSAGACGLLAVGGSVVLSGPLRHLIESLLPAHAAAQDLGGTSLEELLRTAPVARYWASTAQAGVTCATCHDAADLTRRGIAGGGKGATHKHTRALVECLLCARGCALEDGQRGECGARLNRGGQMRSLVYGRPVAIHVDPIEKKPFYHFLPGSQAYSLATAGCPLHCQFCQNWEISQSRPEDHGGEFVPPDRLAASAAGQRVPIIAFTYNEPTVFTEYLTDVARAARPRGLKSVIVSCGFMREAPLAEMCQVLDAIKIDLKGFSPEFYRKVSRAELAPVLRSIQQVHKSGRHLELVNLVVPTLNDSEAMLRGLADWVAGELGPDVPLHFTRFHPDYRLLNLPPTPVETLDRARGIAMAKGLHYVYVGNVPGHPGNHTYCPKCGRAVIRRDSMFVTEMHLQNGKCAYCGTPIAGVWT